MKTFFLQRSTWITGAIAVLVLGLGFVAGKVWEDHHHPFVPAPVVQEPFLRLPAQVQAPIGRLYSVAADSSGKVTWLVAPDLAKRADFVILGNQLLINPMQGEPFSVGAVLLVNNVLLGPEWTTIYPAGNPTPGPLPPPGPTPTPTPTPVEKHKLWIFLVYDQANLSKAHADLIANATVRNALIAKGHALRVLESHAKAVQELKLQPWLAKAGALPALILVSLEGSDRGSVLYAGSCPDDADKLVKTISDKGGL